MELQYRIEKETLLVPMPKEIDHHAAKTISREIDFLIDSWHVKHLVFDFGKTEFMDSSVIGVMLGRSRTMELYRGDIYAVHMGERAEQMFMRAGLSQIVHAVHESRKEDRDEQ